MDDTTLSDSKTKKRIFIASSVEGLPVLHAYNASLDREFEICPWDKVVFNLSSHPIKDLEMLSYTIDYAIFIFHPDDITTLRGDNGLSVRNNVILELGIFIGRLGMERCFIAKPRGIDIQIPSDIHGLTITEYNPARSDNNLDAGVSTSAKQITNTIMKDDDNSSRELHQVKLKLENLNTSINKTGLLILNFLSDQSLRSPYWVPFSVITDFISKNYECGNDAHIQMLKLLRCELIKQCEVSDEDMDCKHYAYGVTIQGLELAMENPIHIELETKQHNAGWGSSQS